MVGAHATTVHSKPWPDQEHGSACGSQNVRQKRPGQQKTGIYERRCLALDFNMDSARYDEQRTDKNDEAAVLVANAQQAGIVLNPKEIVGERESSEHRGDFGVVPFPPHRPPQGSHGHRRQQRGKWEDQPGTGWNCLSRERNGKNGIIEVDEMNQVARVCYTVVRDGGSSVRVGGQVRESPAPTAPEFFMWF